ncbi:MAG TPA: transketolase [Candidatus Limnocylindria bacterium]|nr:transketolase [Candidatus Limnocylindria bacterium]
MNQSVDQLSINTIRTLSMDAVQQANSGHPGTPMSMAPVMYGLWQRHLKYDPADPLWPNRDRFVLSIGHASMLLYATLFLASVRAVDADQRVLNQPTLTLDDLKKFRQLDSKTPGHPEFGLIAGVETTTGPLGQGVANSVGIAMASKWLASYFNRPGFELFDYSAYALCGDGDMMEGISSEAASLASHLKLDNLCWIYDSNRISIEGSTSLALSEDVGKRFEAYGWNVLHVADANDQAALDGALENFRQCHDRPTFIVIESHIAFGAPTKQDTAAAHGEPLGEGEIKLTKKNYGWPEDEKFFVPEGVQENFQRVIGKRGRALRDEWTGKFAAYQKKYPELAEQLTTMQRRELPAGWDQELSEYPADPKGQATRDSSGKVLNALAKHVPWLMGGSADLAPSTKTRLTFDGAGDFAAGNYAGRNLHFGVREHVMAAIVNGMSLCGVRVFGSGFLIFSDYARPAIRLGAIMEVPAIHVFTHDSIGVGEDGPTHQPVEQLASLRAIPGLITLRPGDANEVVEAWRVIMALKHEPVALALTRQPLPTLDRTKYGAAAGLAKGAYILADADGGKPQVILIGTGSEVYLCVEAYEQLKKDGVQARVVSMPSWELFEHQSQEYREKVLPAAVRARVAVEQGVAMGWAKYVGMTGAVIGMKSFGASAPFSQLQKKFGFTVANIVAAAKAQLSG